MKISHFSSYFEIFAGLNLAYAGFELFSLHTLKLLRGRLVDSEAIEELKVELISYKDSLEDGQRRKLIEGNIDTIIPGLQDQQEKINKQIAKSDKEFAELSRGFTPSFIAGSIFCLIILLLVGLEQNWPDDNICTGNVLAIFNFSILYILANSFLPSNWTIPIMSENTTIRITSPFIILGALAGGGYINSISYYCFTPGSQLLIFLFAAFTACSPFIFSLPAIIKSLHKFNKDSRPVLKEIRAKLAALQELYLREVGADLAKT